jgi:hypothetical protein
MIQLDSRGGLLDANRVFSDLGAAELIRWIGYYLQKHYH